MGSEEARIQRYLELSPFNQVGGNPSHNACVGVNGGYNQLTIYEGFKDSVYALLKSVANYESALDPMIYPILFSIRHCIELFLKELYRSIVYLQCIKDNVKAFNKWRKALRIYGRVSDLCNRYDRKINWDNDSDDLVQIARDEKRMSVLEQRRDTLEKYIDSLVATIFRRCSFKQTSHDLNQLIQNVQAVYEVEPRIKELFDIILPILNHYRDIDPDGDAFRYWSDVDDNPHFENRNITLVNVAIVNTHFDAITTIFEKLGHLLEYLQKEYNTGTFTKDLSRAQIEAIAKRIPLWPDEFMEKIKVVKEQIIKEYSITPKVFDQALNIIRRHREFSLYMDKEIVFGRLSDDAIRIFAECSAKKADWKTACEKISGDDLTLLLTFSDISGWRHGGSLAYFSENLDFLYDAMKRQYGDRIDCHDINPIVTISHVISGMEKCGQKTYASALKQYVSQYRA